MSVCVVCERPLEPNHRCPKRVEAAWAARETRAIREEMGEYETPQMNENVRLFVGLAMLERD